MLRACLEKGYKAKLNSWYSFVVPKLVVCATASYPSGQRDLTVNQPAQPSGVRIPH